MLLIVTSSDRKRTVRLLGGTWFLGRSAENDIVLDEETIAPIQANLNRGETGWRLINLDPAIELEVNGVVTSSAGVGPGDRALLGPVSLEFRADEAGVPPTGGSRSAPQASTIVELDVASQSGAWLHDDRTLGVVADLTHVMSAGSDLDAVFDRTLALLERRFGDRAQRGLLATCDEDGADIRVERSFDRDSLETPVTFDMSKTLQDRVLRGRRAVLSTDAAADSQLGSASISSLGIHSVLSVPMLFEERLQGFIYVDSRAESAQFTRSDLEVLALVAGAVAAMIENARLGRTLARENHELKERFAAESSFLASSREMDSLLRDLTRVAQSSATVLLIGESGTGKELAARTLHAHSQHVSGPFVAVNCAAIPDTLIESELFGYAPQSGISGADPGGKPGKFELAQGGTILLDEIGDMALFTQSKLLRVLQEREVERLGSTGSIPIDVRVVSATNKDLLEQVSAGGFREDLYYRLNEIELRIPPLRRRRDEIVPLAMHFARLESGGDVEITEEAREVLTTYAWPGNVRELRGAIRTAIVLGNGQEIAPANLPDRVRSGRASLRYALESLAQIERRHIISVLASLRGNKEAASKTLGIARDTLYRKMKKYEIKETEYQGAPPGGSVTPP